MKKIECVYVAGRLNDMACDYLKNVHKMCWWANEVRKLGVCAYIPAIDMLMGIIFGNWEYPDYFNNSQGYLKRSDAVFVCPGYEESKGTIREIKTAESLGIPVFYVFAEFKEAVEKCRI
jgi:hypothetical protein